MQIMKNDDPPHLKAFLHLRQDLTKELSGQHRKTHRNPMDNHGKPIGNHVETIEVHGRFMDFFVAYEWDPTGNPWVDMDLSKKSAPIPR
jgi:hypothetical protein